MLHRIIQHTMHYMRYHTIYLWLEVIGLIVNPVNSIVPAMAELYKKKGLDPLKIIGVTTLDIAGATDIMHDVDYSL